LPLDREEIVTVVAQRGAHTFGEYRDELARSTDVRVVHGATVLRLLTDDGGARVTQADVATIDGRQFSVAARRFVLATGGLENARLLLLSGRPHERSGLGNEHDLVGRFFMERLSARAGVLLPAQPDLFARAGLYRSHITAGMRIQGAFTLAPDVVRREGLRNAMFWIRQRSRATTAPGVGSLLTIYRMMRRRPLVPGAFPAHVVRIARDLPDVVRTLAHHGLRRPPADPEVFQVGIQAEQAPNRDSRITLGNRRDRFGQAVARMDWRPTDADRASIARSIELFDAGLRRANIGRMIHKVGGEVPQPMFIGNWHHMGTTRMNPDPARGVVDQTCRVHSVSNLYVAGGSVFPTAGYANPTLTIVALAARLADELRTGSWGDSLE
jgi:choline dehydrogenase-like flavoprotein